MSKIEELEKRNQRLKKCVYFVIGISIFMVTLYIGGLVLPGIYFSDFLNTTIITLFAGISSFELYIIYSLDTQLLEKTKEENQ